MAVSASSRFVLLAAMTALLGACAAAMSLPPDLATADRLPVERRGGITGTAALRFGPFEAVEVDRSWTRGTGAAAGVGGVSGSRARAAQSFAFRFRSEGGLDQRVECDATAVRGTVGAGSIEVDLSSEWRLTCTPAGGAGWSLSLSARGNAHPAGTLRVAGVDYTVAGVGSGGGIVPATTRGFHISEARSQAGRQTESQAGRVVAAVERGRNASVLLSAGLADAVLGPFAAAASALILYERIEPE